MIQWCKWLKPAKLSWSTFSRWPCRIPEPESVFTLPSIGFFGFSCTFLCLWWNPPCGKQVPPTLPCFFFPTSPPDRQLVTSCFSNDEKHVDISSQSLVVANSDESQALAFQQWWIFIHTARSQTNCLPPSDPSASRHPFFCLFSCPFLDIFRGFTLEPAYEARLFFDIVSLWLHHISPFSPLPCSSLSCNFWEDCLKCCAKIVAFFVILQPCLADLETQFPVGMSTFNDFASSVVSLGLRLERKLRNGGGL